MSLGFVLSSAIISVLGETSVSAVLAGALGRAAIDVRVLNLDSSFIDLILERTARQIVQGRLSHVSNTA
jgi:hypothetical protein